MLGLLGVSLFLFVSPVLLLDPDVGLALATGGSVKQSTFYQSDVTAGNMAFYTSLEMRTLQE